MPRNRDPGQDVVAHILEAVPGLSPEKIQFPSISIRSSVHFSLRLQVFQVQGKLGSGAKVGHGGTLDPFATGVHASNMNNVLFFAGHAWTCLRSVTLDFVT